MSRRLVYDRESEMLEWAAAVIGLPVQQAFSPSAHPIGLDESSTGSLRSVVVFDRFSSNDCCVHVASDGTRAWMTRGFILQVFAYPFLQREQHRLTALVPSRNKDSLEFCDAFGFVREGLMREAADDGDDIVLLGLLRRDCRFIRPEFLRRVRLADMELA